MTEYIERDALKKRLEDFSKWCKDGRKQGVDFVLDCPLPDIPTADVVEVVRCKECAHGQWAWRNGYCMGVTCEYDQDGCKPMNFFCGNGERREE